MNPSEAVRPRAAINDDNAFFFAALERGELRIQNCPTCDRLTHPPTPWCPACGDSGPTHERMSGLGEVFTFTISHHPQVAGFSYPLIVVVVELREGIRMISELVDVEPKRVRIGMRVELTIRTVGGTTLPLFQPAKDDEWES